MRLLQWSTLFPYTTLFRSRRSSSARTRTTCWHPRAARSSSTSAAAPDVPSPRSEEHTSELQSHVNIVCRLLLEKNNPVVASLTEHLIISGTADQSIVAVAA